MGGIDDQHIVLNPQCSMLTDIGAFSGGHTCHVNIERGLQSYMRDWRELEKESCSEQIWVIGLWGCTGLHNEGLRQFLRVQSYFLSIFY